MNNLLNKIEAIEAAIEQANLSNENVRLISCHMSGNYYELELCTDWMHYSIYIGAVSGELFGLDLRPVIYADPFCGTPIDEFLCGDDSLAA